jgi:hypothetical protein
VGYVLFWVEGMAVALLCLALAAAWAGARGSFFRVVGVMGVLLLFAGPAAFAAHATAPWQREWGKLLPGDLFVFFLSWLLVYLVAGVLLLWWAFRRPAPGMLRTAAGWPRGKLWLGLGGAVLALGLTFWNLNLATRADLAVARQEAGDVLLATSPPSGPESDRAARLYVEAGKDLIAPDNPWRDATAPWRSVARQEEPNWKDPHVVDLVARQEKALVLLRRAAALPPGSLTPRSLDLSAWQADGGLGALRRNERFLLAVDARVKASQGNVGRALEDVAALLGFSRHASEMMAAPETLGTQVMAWRTLEDVLRLAPASKDPLPAVSFPEGISPLRTLHREMAVFGTIWPALFSDDPLRLPEIRKEVGVWSEPPLVYVTETLVTPGLRVSLTPAELASSHRTWDAYRRVLSAPPEGTPRDWAAVRALVETEPAGIFGAVYLRPKEQRLLRDAGNLAALEQLARAGLAAARYRAKHGRYPEHLEQLVPEFLPAMPTDPRDGQTLQLKRFAGVTVLYTLESNPEVASLTEWSAGTYRDQAIATNPSAEKYRDQPVFRLVP